MTDPTPRTAATARESYDVLERALDFALPKSDHAGRMLSRGRLAILMAEYGRLRVEEALAAAEARPNATAATARDALVAKVTSDWDADPYGEYEAARSRLIADLDNLIALAAAEAPGRVAEFRALVDEARANHVRWEHEAEVLEECNRPLCLGARVLLWPDPENPRTSVFASAAPASPGRVAGEVEAAARFMLGLVDEVYGTDHEPLADNLNDAGAYEAEAEFRRHRAVIRAAAEAPGRVAGEVEAACSDRGCLHYDDEEPPCVGHVPSICCAKLSSSIGAAAVADYRDVTPALTAAALAEAMRATGGQVFEGGEAVPAAFYLPWAEAILAAPAPTPSDPVARCVGEHDWETRHPGDLAVCRRCWTVESDATPATRDE